MSWLELATVVAAVWTILAIAGTVPMGRFLRAMDRMDRRAAQAACAARHPSALAEWQVDVDLPSVPLSGEELVAFDAIAAAEGRAA